MAVWELSTEHKKNAIEVQLWCKDGMTARFIEGYRWGTFYCESDEKPDVDLRNPDGEYELGYSGYDWELDNLDDGCWGEWQWPDEVDAAERERPEAIWDEDRYDGLEAQGWSQDDTEYYFQGPLKLVNRDTGEEFSVLDENGNIIPEEADPVVTEWFLASIAPVHTGQYQVTNNKNPNWPFPVYATWDGITWNDDSVAQWRGLANKPE
jgi:hypothetical protein